MRVGILDILALPCRHPIQAAHRMILAKQYASITPQVVSTWCRQLGHETFYATYYGVGDPGRCLPLDLDVVFISCFTNASGLAYMLAKLHKQAGALTVIGGPHAKCFPTDCQRFFDLVVKECDRNLIADILAGHFDPGSVISSDEPFQDIPTVEERMPEIRKAAFFRSRHRYFLSAIHLLASMGCPYGCNFCVDWKNPYRTLSMDRLAADVKYIAENLPGMIVSFHDPNFGIKFDEVLAVLEALPPKSRPRYIMETSLSVLRPDRIKRLGATNCTVVAPGIESWSDYSNKAGVGRLAGTEKLDRVVDHLQRINQSVPYIQANLIFGVDSDAGDEPVALTKEFMRRTPFAWPVVSTPVPLGGTPMYDDYLNEGRILREMPFPFYFRFYLVARMKNYDPVGYYERFISLLTFLASRDMLNARNKATNLWQIKVLNWARTSSARADLEDYRRVLRLFRSDSQFLAFHEGRRQELPEFYHHEYDRIHGRYASLLSRAERRPVLEPASPLLEISGRGRRVAAAPAVS